MAIKQNKLNANDEVVVPDDLKMTDGIPKNSDVAALFTRDNTSLMGVLPYVLGDFTSGGNLAQGEIRNITLAADATTLNVKLNFGSTETISADALLLVDATAVTADKATLAIDATETGVVYDCVGESGYGDMTKGKKFIVSFTRITAQTTVGDTTTNAKVLVAKKEVA